MDNSYQESNPTDYTYGDTGLEDISDSALDETIHDTHEEQIDSDSDFEFGTYFEELENTTNESYYPFPSKIFALLFLLVYSPHPMGRRNLTFVWFILKSMGVKTPSMSSVMAFKLPETEASLKSCLKEVLAEVDILLDLAQFRQMVPDTTATHMDTDALILYHSSAVIAVRDILGFAEPPRIVVRWTPPNFSRMTLQETTSYLSPHPMKAKAAGKPVVMLPIILFSDDTSGNKSKKWHKFESWYMSLAGLPRHINARIENIHFLCCSDSVCPLDMSKPISEELVRLEQEGVVVYDALYKEMVLVIAPLMCIVCDNPRASELLNHLGSSAIKYCRICMCDKTENPDELSELRTMSLALQQIAEIEALRTEQEKIEMRKLYGVRETLNPLFSIHADLYSNAAYYVWHSNGRSARDSSYLSARNTQKGQKIYLKDLPLTLAGKQKNTLEELQSNSHNYNVQLGEHALTDKVLEYRALICSERSLVNSGENIEFVTSYDQFMYGILLATFTTHNAAWCLVQGILPLVSLDNQPILNPYDCPLLELSNTIFCTPSCNIKRPAPLVHECTDTYCELGYNILATRVNFFCIWCCVSTAPYSFSRGFRSRFGGLGSYCERVEQYFIANGISNADRKRAILLSVCGPATFKLIRSLIAPDKPSDKSFEQIVKAVSDHLCPKPSSILQRFYISYFNSCVQKESESIAQFVAELRRLAVHCEFEGTLEIMLRDRLVCGVRDPQLQKRLLAERQLTFSKALELAQAFESAESSARDIQAVRSPSVPLPVHSVDKKGLSVPDSVSCFRCGGKHYATTCKLNNPTGAKSSAARQKGKAARGHSPEKEDSPPREGSKVHSLYNFSSSSNKLFRVTLQVNGVNLPMEIDTGAAVSILSEATYKSTWSASSRPPMAYSNIVLRTYSGHKLHVLGKVGVNVSFQGKTAKLDLIVVSNEGPTLLGRDWLAALDMDINSNIHNVHSIHSSSLQTILDKHSPLFSEDLGKLKGVTVKLFIDRSVKPAFFKHRPVPFALRQRIEAELDRLEKEGIIEAVRFSDWAAPIVPVVKRDGRFCSYLR
ncbi:hypothetical protein EMCRGX_G019103 [Ephydatia muelleri]